QILDRFFDVFLPAKQGHAQIVFGYTSRRLPDNIKISLIAFPGLFSSFDGGLVLSLAGIEFVDLDSQFVVGPGWIDSTLQLALLDRVTLTEATKLLVHPDDDKLLWFD